MGFYDEIADDYDALTGAGDRAARAEGFLTELVGRFPLRLALDVACGTGLYTILLAKLGVRITGVDSSPAMLDQARRHATSAGVGVDWVCAPMQELARQALPRVDAVLCLGNSIPHLLTDADLDAALAGFARLLNPGGIVVLQLLNYGRILRQGERLVGINRQADKEYVRFYDFLGQRVRFNILEIDWSGDEPRHQLHSTELRPYLAEELQAALLRHGWRAVRAHSGLHFADFDPDSPESVMLIARGG
jgi:ubiquinone/menaquinone biosynthesis C-methylase UbiE